MGRSVILDMVRTVAVGAVVVDHILQNVGSRFGGFFGWPKFYHVSIGGVAVTILIILSGIVLGLHYSKTQKYRPFLKKRYLRLYPVYYLVLAIGAALYFIRDAIGVQPHYEITIADIPLAISATYAFVGRFGGPFVITSWFIGTIMCLYGLYPFIEPKIRKHPNVTILILLMISAGTRLLLGHYKILPWRALDWFPLCRIFEFAAGIYLACQIPKKFWNRLNGNHYIERTLSYCAQLTFPIFLVHSPIIHTVKHLDVPNFVWITIFLAASVAAAAGLLEIDKRIFNSLRKQRPATAKQ